MSQRIDLKELAVRESEQVEWKDQVANVEDVVATICAFANDLANLGGGYVVCGAREGKDEHGFPAVEMVGLEPARLKEVEGRVMALCRSRVDPSPQLIVEEQPTSDPRRRVLIFVVPASRQAHQFRPTDGAGRYYVRLSRETREARNGLLRDLLVRKGDLEPWDLRVSASSSLEQLDLLALRDALQRMRLFDPHRGVEPFLSESERLSPLVPSLCVQDPLGGPARPRNFAQLLFGRQPQQHAPGAYCLFSVYPGEDRSEPHAERHEVTGNLLQQVRTLIELLNVQAYVAYDKRDPEAPNALKYPQRALHEAMVNAVAHRDYELPDPIRVTVFSNRIEIVSPGSLPMGIDVEAFRAGRVSPRWRNQSLAWFMSRLQLAQAEGQGIPTILRSMREEGCPPPAFEVNEARVTCVLPAHPRHSLVRELQAIESALSLGEAGLAFERVRPLLAGDPYNFRTVRLFVETALALRDSEALIAFVEAHRSSWDRFPALALVHLADGLASGAATSGQAAELAKELLARSLSGHFEEREARRLVLSLLKLRQDPEALAFLDRQVRQHPEWAQNPSLRQLRGRTYLGLARRCIRTGKDRKLPAAMRSRAWKEAREYLDRAERELADLQGRDLEPAVAHHLELDLAQLRELRFQATPPQQRPGSSSRET
jgi:predicted HTH transcriptional regulator